MLDYIIADINRIRDTSTTILLKSKAQISEWEAATDTTTKVKS